RGGRRHARRLGVGRHRLVRAGRGAGRERSPGYAHRDPVSLVGQPRPVGHADLRPGPALRQKVTRLATSIVPDLGGYEIWFLTGSQGLYGEETLRQVAQQSREIADTLNGCESVPVALVWKPVLTDAEAIRRMVLEANAQDRVIGLIAWMHTFSPAKMWIGGLDEIGRASCRE